MFSYLFSSCNCQAGLSCWNRCFRQTHVTRVRTDVTLQSTGKSRLHPASLPTIQPRLVVTIKGFYKVKLEPLRESMEKNIIKVGQVGHQWLTDFTRPGSMQLKLRKLYSNSENGITNILRCFTQMNCLPAEIQDILYVCKCSL